MRNCSAVIQQIPKKLGDPGRISDSMRIYGVLLMQRIGRNLELADRSITEPIGIAKDVRLMVGKFQFPAGHSYHALIDVYGGEITLRVGKEAITFNLDQTSKYTADYDHMTANKIDVIEMACNEIPIDPKRSKKRQPSHALRNFCYVAMPCGLCNAPGTIPKMYDSYLPRYD
ncbi:hypothetical protein Tco_0840156 [Tanacetum coccineum]|uniref:Reverse transcriptase domain-containing protein n=1 Tax=Tanacetum coccineum TaxID=301880 RepID=A0ABQ5AXI3_9ASTR